MNIDIEEIKLFIRSYIMNKTPGLLEILNSFSLRCYGIRILDLLFQYPEKFMELLMNYYKDIYTAKFTAQYLFVRPILVKVKRIDLEEKLVEILLKNSNEFRKTLKDLGLIV